MYISKDGFNSLIYASLFSNSFRTLQPAYLSSKQHKDLHCFTFLFSDFLTPAFYDPTLARQSQYLLDPPLTVATLYVMKYQLQWKLGLLLAKYE